MTRAQLEHLIRAAASIAEDDDIVVIGSQSVLGQFPDPPASLLASIEADLYPKNRPERWDLIDASIGEESQFHRTFGYYAQGVDETTAVLPGGWKDRLVAIRSPATRGATGWALEIHDLLISKCVAAREKDIAFVGEAIRGRLARQDTLLERLGQTALDQDRRETIERRIRAAFARRGD